MHKPASIRDPRAWLLLFFLIFGAGQQEHTCTHASSSTEKSCCKKMGIARTIDGTRQGEYCAEWGKRTVTTYDDCPTCGSKKATDPGTCS